MKTKNGLRNSSKAYYDYLVGPIKIKDGLFMGDEIAAKDMDFIISNKVTHVINTVVKKVPNLWEKYGIQYLSVNWVENEQNIFDKKNNTLNVIFNFIEEAMSEGQSCLVHSLNGKSKAGTVVIAYLIKKYCWSLQKSLQFIQCKKENFAIKTNFLIQLQDLSKRMAKVYNLSYSWDQAANQEDLLLANTFKNMKVPSNTEKIYKTKKKKITWGDKVIVSPNKSTLSTTIGVKFKEETPSKHLKSILKGFQDEEPKQVEKEEIEKPTHNPKLSKSQIVDSKTINTSVNNYMTPTTQKYTTPPRYGTRPQSSDNKQKKLESKSGSKLMPYENIISSFRSPYDSVFMNKIGSNTKGKKKDDVKPFTTHERTFSNQQKKRPLNYVQLMNKGKEEGTVGVKKLISSNPRQNIFKYK